MENFESKRIWAERKEPPPKISFEFFFSGHETAKDLENLKDAFDRADVYIPEVCGWSDEDVEVYQNISQGKMTPNSMAKKYGISKRSKVFKEMQILYKSEKPILIIDLPEKHELYVRYNKSLEIKDEALDQFNQGGFREALELMHRFIEEFAEITEKREAFIKKNIEEQVEPFVQKSPQLKNKKEIKILLRLGAAHTTLSQALGIRGERIQQTFSKMPYLFGADAEAKRRKIFNKPVSDELVARALLEESLYPKLRRLTDDSQKLTELIQKISQEFTIKDIKEISEDLEGDIIIEALKKRGVKIPESEEEIDKLLGLPKKIMHREH